MEMKKLTAKTLRKTQGFFSVQDAAETVGVKYTTFFHWVQTEIVPAPSHTIGGGKRKYYSTEEMKQLRKLLHN